VFSKQLISHNSQTYLNAYTLCILPIDIPIIIIIDELNWDTRELVHDKCLRNEFVFCEYNNWDADETGFYSVIHWMDADACIYISVKNCAWVAIRSKSISCTYLNNFLEANFSNINRYDKMDAINTRKSFRMCWLSELYLYDCVGLGYSWSVLANSRT